ncbi:MAG: ABC transporter ATP-binding protein [Chloroflexi bacterium]|nr:MAG: ABC transporter ATP-binding protein [Chloroflexota bacterium]
MGCRAQRDRCPPCAARAGCADPVPRCSTGERRSHHLGPPGGRRGRGEKRQSTRRARQPEPVPRRVEYDPSEYSQALACRRRRRSGGLRPGRGGHLRSPTSDPPAVGVPACIGQPAEGSPERRQPARRRGGTLSGGSRSSGPRKRLCRCGSSRRNARARASAKNTSHVDIRPRSAPWRGCGPARQACGRRPWLDGAVAVAVAAQAAANVLLRVEGLRKEIGDSDILVDINFELYKGEILGLIGPNGAGKTTLMECLAGLRPRTAGMFYVGDEAPADWDPKGLMFYLPNNVAPYAELYTIEVLTFFGRVYDVDPRRWERIILDELSLQPVLRKRVNALSKGNMQRLLIALALMSPQPLLALDEPFDGLDLHQTRAMMSILRNLRAQSRTLLLCIHQLVDAERICDRVLLLSEGRIIGVGTLDELRAKTGLPSGSLEEIFLALT